MNLDAIGGRRFILAVLTLIVCSGLLCFKVLSDGSYTAIILATVGAYIAAGTFERTSEIKADVQKTVAQSSTPTS